MPSLPVQNSTGAEIGTVALPERLFGAKWNPELVQQVAVAERANIRQPLAHTKDRSEVSGGGRKPWRQKHTGRARHGSSRSPLWVGGGITFGPRRERVFAQKVNRRMRRGALASLLSRKLTDGEVRVVDSLVPAAGKTKLMVLTLKQVTGGTGGALCVVPPGSVTAFRAGRNIPATNVVGTTGVTVTSCLSHRYLIFDRRGLDAFIESKPKLSRAGAERS